MSRSMDGEVDREGGVSCNQPGAGGYEAAWPYWSQILGLGAAKAGGDDSSGITAEYAARLAVSYTPKADCHMRHLLSEAFTSRIGQMKYQKPS